jgi:hypothetical protein
MYWIVYPQVNPIISLGRSSLAIIELTIIARSGSSIIARHPGCLWLHSFPCCLYGRPPLGAPLVLPLRIQQLCSNWHPLYRLASLPSWGLLSLTCAWLAMVTVAWPPNLVACISTLWSCSFSHRMLHSNPWCPMPDWWVYPAKAL